MEGHNIGGSGGIGCRTVPDGARGCQMVPEGARGCQRGQSGTFVAPVLDKASQLISAKVSIAEVEVVALIDTGATTSCCRWGWYKEWKSHLGSLRQSSTMVVGVGNVPIEVKGLSKPLTLQWEDVEGQCQLMVLTTLTDVDVILGMDVLSQFDVKIDSRNQVASPARELCTSLILDENVKIPAGKSRVFLVNNILPGLTLFEPGANLPEGLLGVPALGKGSRLAVQLDNLSEKDVILNSKWNIGQLYPVQRADPPKAGHLAEVPGALDNKQREALNKLLREYKDVFSKEGDPISSTSLVEHKIYTEGPPVRLPFRRQNPLVRAQEQSQVKEMLRDGVIRPSISPWASPVVMVKKKDGSMRFCVDFRKVNDATIKDAHPLPRIDDTLESLHGAKFFSTLDLKSGYWQVPIREQDKEKTAFRTCSGQLYEFNQLPFGLCNAPATFSRLMDSTLAGLAWNTCLYYLDGIIVFSASWEEHLERLKAVFERLRRANLKLGAAKCHLARREVSFLGYKVTPEGLEPEPKLMEAINRLTPPTSVTEVRSFLGLVGYYRRFIRRFSDKAAPLNALLHKDQEWRWTPHCQEAFELLKGEISQKPVSAYPDFSKPFRLYTDASNLGLGAILAHNQEGKECIILEGKIQVKEEEAEEIIKGVHRQGHLGEHKTWKAFNRKFLTTEGRKKCREVVRTCPEGQLGKDYKQRHLPKGTIESSRPWNVVSIDIMGPFPYDDKAKQFIVTMMDVYSRYIMAIPVGNHTAKTVSKCLYEHVVAYFGVPRLILSDRGAEFTSLVWESLTQILDSNIWMASPYYPQGNAVIERSHRTLNNMLRTMLLEKKGQGWSTLLPSIMLYMNSMTDWSL